jgi:hypothetical protein
MTLEFVLSVNCTSHVTRSSDSLDSALALVRQMEATFLGLKKLRDYVPSGRAREMLEALIEETETHLAQTKRRLVR